jgi:hypothetical protein
MTNSFHSYAVRCCAITVAVAFASAAFGADPDVVSPVVSFQYADSFGNVAFTNSTISSSIVSYQYVQWPGDGVLHLQSSRQVSYYYQFTSVPPLNIVMTNRTPRQSEIVLPLPALPTPSQLLAFHGGIFTTNLNSVRTTNPTIVLTHGWNSGPNGWASNMASMVRANGITDVNLVAWDWSKVARSLLPGIPEAQTGDQGRGLGVKLLLEAIS